MSTSSTSLSSPSGLGLLDAPGAWPHPAEFYEHLYRDAAGELAKIPWARGRANPAMVSWLNAEAAGLLRPGARAVVVGCGLGDDVFELVNRGYDASGFDVSPTAIEWARRRFPDLASAFFTADVLNMPSRCRHRFDLVVEVHTLQSVHPSLREATAAAVVNLACPRGLILGIARGREDSELLESAQEPPFPFSPQEYTGLFESHGWQLTRLDDFLNDEQPPQRQLRGTFTHP